MLTRREFLKASALVGGSVMLTGATALAEEKPIKVRAAVFSPTGGTMNAAYLLASALCDQPEMMDQTPLSSRQETIAFAADELAIFAAPAYAGKIPYAPKLFENLKGDKTPCVLVASYGNRAAENNWAQMHKLATDNGFVVIGAIQIVTPHIFGARAGHSRPDVADVKDIQAFAAEIRKKIESGSLASITVEGDPAIVGKPSLHSVIDKQLDASKCLMCGLCVNNCSVGAIDPKTLVINNEICIECQRCSHVCPVAARTYITAWDGTDAKYLAPRKPITYVV